MADWNQLSILEAAETILGESTQPMSFVELYQAICEVKSVADDDKGELISQVYADFIISAKFVYVGDDLWDLKSRQSIDLWDKDGAFYDEFPDYKEEMSEDVEEEPEEEEYDEEEDEEAEYEEEEADKYEEDLDFDEYDEDDIDYDDFDDVEEDFVEDESEIASEEEDEYDEDKYNEYMDDYEKMYDE